MEAGWTDEDADEEQHPPYKGDSEEEHGEVSCKSDRP